MSFDIKAMIRSDSTEGNYALFKTADKYAYNVYPCASLFAAKPHAGKSIYLPYAIKRWENKDEAFGLVPNNEFFSTEVRPICLALDRGEIIQGIKCINPFENHGKLSCETFSQLIEYLHRCGFNVIFIDNLRALNFNLKDIPLNLQVSDQQAFIGDYLSKLSKKLGIYIMVLMHLSKSKGVGVDIQDTILGTNGIVGSYQGACYITNKTNSHIDLLFDWRTKLIERRVFFGSKLNELIPESETSRSERIEGEQYEKYGGYEHLRELLSHFKDGPVSVRSVMSCMKITSCKSISGLLKKAKEDGYLMQDTPRSSYRLTEKGFELVAYEESAGHVAELISLSDMELFYRFVKETLGRDASSVSAEKTIKISTYSKWKSWKEKYVDSGEKIE
jgi:hypothetical protein